MTTRPREDIVQDLLEKQIELYVSIKNTIEKCSCTVDCDYHSVAIIGEKLSKILLKELEATFLKQQEAKLYLTDVNLLMNGIEKFAQHKVEEKIYKADVQPRKSKGWNIE